MEYFVLIDAQTTAGAYFLSTPMYSDALMVCGVTSCPVLRCTNVDWDKPSGFVRLVQVPDAQKARPRSEWTLPSRCIALVTAWPENLSAGPGSAIPLVKH